MNHLHEASPPAGETVPGIPSEIHRFHLPVEVRGTFLGVDVRPVEVPAKPAPEPVAPAPVFVDPLPEGPGRWFGAMHQGSHVGHAGGFVARAHAGYGGEDPTRLRTVEERKDKVPRIMPSPGLALLGAIMDGRPLDDDRKGTVAQQVAAEGWLRTEIASITRGDAFQEEEFGWYSAAVQIALIEFRDRGGDPERGSLIAGAPAPARLWRPSCTAVDLIEKDQREAREAQARSDAARSRVAAVMAGPNKRTCYDRGVIETHVPPGCFPPAWTEGRAPDHVMSDGTRVWIDPAFQGLAAPASPPYTIMQGEDVSPIPYALASRPAPSATDEGYFRLIRRLAVDTAPHPPWRPLNAATRRMLDDRMPALLRARSTIQQHERQIVVRGCLVRPDVAARRELDALRERAREDERQRQLTMPPQIRDSEEEQARTVERSLAGRLEALTADYARAAGPGYIPFGSCIVTVAAEIGEVASGLLDKVREFFSARTEATSEDLASALGVRHDSPDLARAAEASGWRKVRVSRDGARERVWVKSA